MSVPHVVPDLSPGQTPPDPSPRQQRLDRVVRLACELLEVPRAAINLVGEHDVTPLAIHGAEPTPLPADIAFCTTTVAGEGQMLVSDAAVDRRFRDNPLVTQDPHIRFYAGQPLRASGRHVGTLCVLDSEPRDLDARSSQILKDLAAWVENELTHDSDLLEAREVQQRLLPRTGLVVDGLEIAGACSPAREVGGDVYDWQLVHGYAQVFVCDVMGKGVPAAVVAAGLRAVMRGNSRHHTLGGAVDRLVQSMQEDLESAGTFATFFAARVDPETGLVEYVDCGHNLSAVIGADGTVRRLSSHDLPLGVLPDQHCIVQRERLAPGETLLVLSDGVLDVHPDADHALAYAAADHRHESAEGVVGAVLDHAVRMAPPKGYNDDMTVLAVRRAG